jgi:hypothetical protein
MNLSIAHGFHCPGSFIKMVENIYSGDFGRKKYWIIIVT